MGDIRTTTGEKLPPTATERRGRKLRILLMTLLLLLAAGVAGHRFEVRRHAPAAGYATTSGYAEVRSAIIGQVAEILVTSGETVGAGDVLVRLDDHAEQAAVAEARRQVAKSEAELAHREAASAQARREQADRLRIAELEAGHAARRLEVTRQLHARGLASGRQLSDDEFAVQRSTEVLRALREADWTAEERAVEVLRQDVALRRDALARATTALEQRSVRAPRDGRVVRYTFYIGELVRPDMVLYEIFEGGVDTLRLRIPERYATLVRPGMAVEARLGSHRTLPATRFHGTVELLRDVVEGDGLRNYRVAYCAFDRNGLEVAPGTSAEARIRIGRSSLWMLLLRP